MGAFQASMDRIPIFIHENKQLSTHIIRDITCLGNVSNYVSAKGTPCG